MADPVERGAAAARRARRRRGMTLVEVTIALAILGFGILAAAAAQLSAMKFSMQSRERTEAQYLAQQSLESFMSMPASVLTSSQTGASYSATVETLGPDLANGLSGQYQREFKITPSTAGTTSGTFSISVRVTWTGSRGTSENVVIESFRAGA